MTDTRAAFEASMRERGWGDYELLREQDDDGAEVYCIHDARLAWGVWQAAIKHERAEASKLADALMALLADTQHAKHPSCTDGGYCPVRDAREALEAFNSRIGGAAE
jgi:hypothetical protein